MEYSTRNLPDGISLQFYKPGVQPLTEDGCLDLLLLHRAGDDRADVVIKASNGGLSGVRARHLDLIYKLLLDDCRSGALGDDAKLVLGAAPANGERVEAEAQNRCGLSVRQERSVQSLLTRRLLLSSLC